MPTNRQGRSQRQGPSRPRVPTVPLVVSKRERQSHPLLADSVGGTRGGRWPNRHVIAGVPLASKATRTACLFLLSYCILFRDQPVFPVGFLLFYFFIFFFFVSFFLDCFIPVHIGARALPPSRQTDVPGLSTSASVWSKQSFCLGSSVPACFCDRHSCFVKTTSCGVFWNVSSRIVKG